MESNQTCGTCRFRGTSYCAHPHTCYDGSSRCLKSEIAERIHCIKHGLIVGAKEKPKAEIAEKWLEEW